MMNGSFMMSPAEFPFLIFHVLHKPGNGTMFLDVEME
jgi:hypothetical protein